MTQPQILGVPREARVWKSITFFFIFDGPNWIITLTAGLCVHELRSS